MRTAPGLFLHTLGLALLLGVLACGSDDAGGDHSAAAPERASLVVAHRIQLQERAADPIVDLARVHASSDGRLAFADRRASRVRVFDRDGSEVVALGRRGAGPGEFRNVTDVAFDSRGRLVTIDQALGRVTRFDREFRLDTTLALAMAHPHRVEHLDDDLLVTLLEEPRLIRLSPGLEVVGDYAFPDSTPFRVPYWGSVLKADLAVMGGDILVALNLVYPVRRLSPPGPAFDSVAVAPPHFVRAPEPALGQFVGAAQSRIWEWLRSFDTIDRIAVLQDSLLLVVHGRFDPVQGEPWRIVHSSMDVYGADGRLRAAEIPLPGRFLGAIDAIYLLDAMPPEPWTIGAYRLER